MTDPRDYGERLKDCILSAVLGEEIGRGDSRTVFALGSDRVVKVEAHGTAFNNQHEWTLWHEVAGTKWAKWFAPCLGIDAFGAALVMARTKPMTPRKWKALKRVPNFMADLRPQNWGIYEGRPVCHDYGNHRFFALGLADARLVERKER